MADKKRGKKQVKSKKENSKKIQKLFKPDPTKVPLTDNPSEDKSKSLKELFANFKNKVFKPKRIPSGISGFDALIEGGFLPYSTNILVGGSGSGKTIFGMNFLMQGIKENQPGLYITFEEKKEEFYQNMLEFGWNLLEAEEKGLFIFLEYSPEKVKLMLEEGGGDIESIVIKNKIKRVVIDSITSFTLLFDDELEKRQAALGLFDMLRKWSCTTVLTVQENTSVRKGRESSPIEFEADSIILLYFIRMKKERQRFVEVLKMRGTNHSKHLHQFHISNGLRVIPTHTEI